MKLTDYPLWESLWETDLSPDNERSTAVWGALAHSLPHRRGAVLLHHSGPAAATPRGSDGGGRDGGGGDGGVYWVVAGLGVSRWEDERTQDWLTARFSASPSNIIFHITLKQNICSAVFFYIGIFFTLALHSIDWLLCPQFCDTEICQSEIFQIILP